MNITDNVRYFMQLKRMTASELSKKSGMSLSMISMVLQGNRTPGSQTILRLASGLGVTVNTLITGIVPDYLDPVDQELGQRELVKEDPRAFATMLRVVKKASDK